MAGSRQSVCTALRLSAAMWPRTFPRFRSPSERKSIQCPISCASTAIARFGPERIEPSMASAIPFSYALRYASRYIGESGSAPVFSAFSVARRSTDARSSASTSPKSRPISSTFPLFASPSDARKTPAAFPRRTREMRRTTFGTAPLEESPRAKSTMSPSSSFAIGGGSAGHTSPPSVPQGVPR